jgi:hypothetical protein
LKLEPDLCRERLAAEADALEFVLDTTVPPGVTNRLVRLFDPTPTLFSWCSGKSNLFFFTTPFHVFDESFKQQIKID